MSAFDGSGMLGMLGENPLPQGMPDELRKAGIDPAKVGSCAPQSHGVRGCPLWNECIFGQPRFGGFKGKSGPHYVGYYLRTIEGAQKQGAITCHAFVRTLVGRMRAGNAAREQGQAHEQIRIIAQEGEMINVNPLVQVNPADTKTPTADWKRNPHRVPVHRHPRPGENPQVTYDQQLWAEEVIRRKYDPEFQGRSAADDDGEPNEPIGTSEDTTLDFSPDATPVTAEPLGKGKK